MSRVDRFRHTAGFALAVGFTLLLAACSGTGGTSSTTTSPAPATTTTAATTTTSGTMTTVPTTVTTTTVALPDNASHYAVATFEAWQSGNQDLLQQLTNGDAYQSLSSHPPSSDGQWDGPQCDGAAGSTYCQWDGASGSLVLRVENQTASAGDAHAVIEARFE